MSNRTKRLMWAFSVVLLLGVMGYAGPLARRAPDTAVFAAQSEPADTVEICTQGRRLIVEPEFLLVKRNQRVLWKLCEAQGSNVPPDSFEVDLGEVNPTNKRFVTLDDPIAKIRLSAKRGDYKYGVGATRGNRVYYVDPELIVRP